MKFPIAVEPGRDTTAFGVVVPDLPGCFPADDTLEEAYTNAVEAIEAWVLRGIDRFAARSGETRSWFPARAALDEMRRA